MRGHVPEGAVQRLGTEPTAQHGDMVGDMGSVPHPGIAVNHRDFRP